MEHFHLVSILFRCFLVTSTWAVSPGPDTLVVDENTYYADGYDHRHLKGLNETYKYKHSNITGLEELVHLEWNIYSNITKICQDFDELPTDNFTDSVQEYLQDFRLTSLALVQNKSPDDVDELSAVKILTTNIITPFLAIRRFRNYIRPWIVASKRNKNSTFFQDSIFRYLKSVYHLKDGPFAVELHISMLSILLPHFMYDLQAKDIANGNIRGKDLGIALQACHSLEIGVHGVAMAFFPLGIQWLDVAVNKIQDGDATADLSFAMEWLAKATHMHDNAWRPEDSLRFHAIYFSKPLANFTEGEERKWRKQLTCQDPDKLHSLLDTDNSKPWYLHWSVCKGDVEQSDEQKSKLFCWYERKVDPVWTIGPLKAEFISRFPLGEVVQYYGLLHHDFMEAVRTDPAKVHRTTSFVHAYNLVPTPKIYLTVVHEIKNSTLKSKLDTLVEKVTGLRSWVSVRGMQAVSYVPGGHSFIHQDWHGFEDSAKLFDHAMATFMFYIEQPEEGGETAYPRSLVKTNPLKGSAVFSFNLLPSGRNDDVSPHGACPLISGSKWVVTKDIMYEDQTHLSCGLQENVRQEILVNGKTKYS